MTPSIIAQASEVASKQPELNKLKKACDGMEGSFLRQLLKTMRDTVAQTELGGDDTGADTYRGMFDDAIADKLAERSALGISKMAFHSMAPQILNGKVTH